MTTVIFIVGGLFLVMFGVIPLVIFATFRISASGSALLLSVEQLPPSAYRYYGEIATAMGEAGFELTCYLSMPDYIANIRSVASVWVNRPAGQWANAVVMYTAKPSAVEKQNTSAGFPIDDPTAPAPILLDESKYNVMTYVEFSTYAASGFSVLTSNSKEVVTVFKKPIPDDTLHAPIVDEDLALLYRLHLYREQTLLRPNEVRYLPPPGEEAAHFMRLVTDSFLVEATGGRLRYEPRDDTVRATLLGAYIMTWRMLPPLRQILRRRALARARGQLAAAERATVRPGTSVQVSHDYPRVIEERIKLVGLPVLAEA